MAFIDAVHLPAYGIQQSECDSFEKANPNILQELCITAGNIVTRHSGIPAPDDSGDASEELRHFTAVIVHYFMLRYQNGATEEQRKARREAYKDALQELDTMQGIQIDNATFEPVTILSTTTARLGERHTGEYLK